MNNEHDNARSNAVESIPQQSVRERESNDHHVDGNAAGGLLRELFAMDVTASDMTCAGCGAIGPVGALTAYGHRMGVVLRCADCDSAVLRLSRTAHGYFLDLSGARVMHVPVPVG